MYVLMDSEGRMATYDLDQGPSLTRNRLLAYAWSDHATAERQRPLYEEAFSSQLTVTEIPRPQRLGHVDR